MAEYTPLTGEIRLVYQSYMSQRWPYRLSVEFVDEFDRWLAERDQMVSNGRLETVRKYAYQLMRPFLDGTPDSEGEYIGKQLLKILDGEE